MRAIIIYENLDIDLATAVKQIFTTKDYLVGLYINHVWSTDGSDVMYTGRICKHKVLKTKQELVISYWEAAESDNDGTDYKVKLDEVLADIVIGDISFM